MQIYISIFIGIFIILSGLLVIIGGIRWFRSDELSDRITKFVTEEQSQNRQFSANQAIRRLDLAGTFFDRIVLPAIQRSLASLGRFTPRRMMENLNHKLTIAGNPRGFGAREFFGLRVIFFIFGIIGGLFFYIYVESSYQIISSVLLFLFLTFLPSIWLIQQIRRRQKAIQPTAQTK